MTYFGFRRSRQAPTTSTVTKASTTGTIKESIQKSYGKSYVVSKSSDGSFNVTKIPQEYLKFKNKREPSKNVTDTYSAHTIKVSSSGKVLEETYRGVYDRKASNTRNTKAVYTKRYVNYSTGVERQYKTRSVGRYGRDKVKLSYERKVSGKTRSFTVTDQSTDRARIAAQAAADQGSPLTPEQASIIKTYGAAGLKRDSFKNAAPKQSYTKSQFKALLSAEKAARVATTTAQQSALKESEFRYGRLSEKVGRYQAFKNTPKVETTTVAYRTPGVVRPAQTSAFKTAVKGALYPVTAPLSFAKNAVVSAYNSASNFLSKNESEIAGGAKYGLKTVGYIAGQPFVFAGQQVEKAADWYAKNPIGQDQSAASLKSVGEFTTGYGKGFKEKPGTSLISFGVGSAIGFGVPAIKGVVGSAVKFSKIPVAASVAKYTPKIIEGGAVLGFGAVYAADVSKRVGASDKPYETFGGIASSEFTPLAAGGRTGELAYEGVKDLGVRAFSKHVPAEKLVDPKVLSGKQTFETSKSTTETLKQFQSQRTGVKSVPAHERITIKYSEQPVSNYVVKAGNYYGQRTPVKAYDTKGSIRTFHATKGKFGKDTTARGIEAGAGSDKALGTAMRNIKNLHLEGKTVKQISASTGKSKKFVTSTLKETEGLYVAPKLPVYFLGLGRAKNIKYSLTSESAGSPSAISIRVADVKRVPKEVRTLEGTKAVSEGDVYLAKQAGKDAAFITPRSEKRFTVESEAVLPKGSVIKRNVKGKDTVSKIKGYSEYTVIEGRAVPIYEYKVQKFKQAKPETIKELPSIKDDAVYSEISAKARSSEKYYSSSQSKQAGRLVTIPYSSVSQPKSSSSVVAPSYSSSVKPTSSYKYIPSLSSSVTYTPSRSSSIVPTSSRTYGGSSSTTTSRPPSRPPYRPPSRPPYRPPAIPPSRPPVRDPPHKLLDFIPQDKITTSKTVKRPKSKRLFKYVPTVYSIATRTEAKLTKKKKRREALTGLSLRPISI